MSLLKTLAAATSVALIGTAAQAAVTITLIEGAPGTSTMSAAGAATIPNGHHIVDVALSGMAAGEDWTNSALRVEMTTGSILQNNPGGGAFANNVANGGFFGLVPALEADTFVSGPAFTAPTIVGGCNTSMVETPGGTDEFTSSVIGAAFGDTNTNNGAAFVIARLLVTDGSQGVVRMRVFTTVTGPNNPGFFTLPFGGVVPEPTALAAVAGLGALAMRRRRA